MTVVYGLNLNEKFATWQDKDPSTQVVWAKNHVVTVWERPNQKHENDQKEMQWKDLKLAFHVIKIPSSQSFPAHMLYSLD